MLGRREVKANSTLLEPQETHHQAAVDTSAHHVAFAAGNCIVHCSHSPAALLLVLLLLPLVAHAAEPHLLLGLCTQQGVNELVQSCCVLQSFGCIPLKGAHADQPLLQLPALCAGSSAGESWDTPLATCLTLAAGPGCPAAHRSVGTPLQDHRSRPGAQWNAYRMLLRSCHFLQSHGQCAQKSMLLSVVLKPPTTRGPLN